GAGGVPQYIAPGFAALVQRTERRIDGREIRVRRGHDGTIRRRRTSLSADPAFPGTSGQGIVATVHLQGAGETGRAVDVTSHRRSWMLRAGLVVAMAAGTVVSVATPALAAPGPSISNINLDNGNLQPGGQANLSFTITADEGVSNSTINVSITSSLNP